MKKKLLVLLCMLISMLAFSITCLAASETLDDETIKNGAKNTVQSIIEQDLTGFNPEQAQENELNIFGEFYAIKDTLGKFVSIDEATVVNNSSDAIEADVVATFEKDVVTFRVKYDENTYLKSVNVTRASEENSGSLGSKMATAGLNTLMGMGTVFVVLIFISFIIAQFIHISNFTAKGQKEKEEIAMPAEVIEEVQQEEEELIDDTQLVAVITAAISAYLEENAIPETADGFVVRSIKKKTRNW